MRGAAVSDLGRNPIPGDNPTGEKATYEPEYTAVKDEIDKLTSLGDAQPNWNTVEENAKTVLAEKSKDVAIAAYLARAWWEMRSFDGLAEACELLGAMLSTFGADLFPPKARGRSNSIEWFAGQLTPGLEDLEGNPPTSLDLDGLNKAVKAVEELEKVIAESAAFTDDARPAIGPLRRALQGRIDAVNATPDGGGGDATPAAGDPAAAAQPAGGAAPPSGVAPLQTGAIRTRDEAFNLLQRVADFLRKAEPHSPVSYLVDRAARWGRMGFEDLYQEIFSKKNDARQYIWETLGIEDKKKQS
jgi:type VI secretion system protein VasJ